MNSFDAIVKYLKKNRDMPISFVTAEGDKGDPILVLADRTKGAPALATTLKKSGRILAQGNIVVTEDGVTKFLCSRRHPSFRPEALRPYFTKIPEKPLIEDVADPEDAAAVEAGDEDAPEGLIASGLEDGFEDVPEDGAETDIVGPDGEKLILLWSKSIGAALRAKGLPRSEPASLMCETFAATYDAKVEFRLPALFMRILARNNAQPFAQTVIDAVNSEFDRCIGDVAEHLHEATPNTKEATARVEKFSRTSETIATKAWDAFVNRYEVPKGYERKRGKAIIVPVAGGAAATAGLASSLATGAVPGAIASSIAVARATMSGLDAYRLYIEDIHDAVGKLETSVDRLQTSFVDAGKNVSKSDKAGETGRALFNALTGAGFTGTLKAVRGDIETLDARLARKEQKVGKLIPVIERMMREISAGHLSADKEEAIGKKVSKALDTVAAKNADLGDLRQEIDRAKSVVEKIDDNLENPALTIEYIEKVATLLVAATETGANMVIGGSGAANALDGISTAVGSLADMTGLLEATEG